MKTIVANMLSHFQPTVKALIAAAGGFVTYLQVTGKLADPTKLTWVDLKVAFISYILSMLVPARAPKANAVPPPSQGA